MRKAKKSVRVEVIALSLFIVALVGYATFFTVGSSVNAQMNIDAGGTIKCAGELKKCQQMPETTEAEKKAKQECLKKNEKGATAIICGTGKCTAFCEQGICRGDGGNPGCPKASDKQADGKQKEEPKKDEGKGGGGEPPKMPEIPKKEPKKEEPKQDQKPCPTTSTSIVSENGQQTTVVGQNAGRSPGASQAVDQYGRPCPTNAPANFFASLKDNLLKFLFASTTPLTSDDLVGLTPEEQLQKISDLINGNPSLVDKPARIEATNKLANQYEKSGFQGTVEQVVAHTNTMSVDDINNAVNNVQDDLKELAKSQSAELTPSVIDSNPESSTNVINAVTDWLKGWFGF